MDFLKLGEALVEGERERGNARSGFALRGYRGSHAGRASYGCRPDGSIISLSGHLASVKLDDVLAIATNASRVDVAVTVRLEPPQTDIQSAAFDMACLAPRGEGTPPEAELRKFRDGHATFYLGKRSSERYLRVYNKELESKEVHYRGCHRYEVETKALCATAVADALRVAECRSEWVRGFVYSHCASRGVVPVFPATGHVALLPGFRRRTDDDTSLAWIASAVRPSVGRILANGRGGDLLGALGMNAADVDQMMRAQEREGE